MADETVFSVEMFPVGVPLTEESQSLSDMPGNSLPAPQLVMLANVAAVTAAEGGGGDGSAADEKEMMELKTVGCSYSDSDDESIIRYSYDNQNHREFCIIEYPESPGPGFNAVVVGNGEEEREETDGDKAEDLSRSSQPHSSASTKTPEKDTKHKDTAATAPAATATTTTEATTKKKKPFHCKPCHFQAQNEQEFVEHLSTHGISKMMVVNRVEGRSRTKGREGETAESQVPAGGDVENSGEAAVTAGDIKGLIRCERCGYNTNRYDHYIAHLKHHSKEGDDHRVFKCTLCPYTTVSQYHWRKHLRNHFPSKLHTCSQCSYFSDRKSNYIQHIRTHTGVRPFQCLYCDYSSSQKTHLTRHMRTHSGERPFKCESCNYLAANQHEVTRHARQVHNGPKPLSCPYCEYKTADRSNFKKHVELHLNPRQFLCPLCKYAASKKCNLQYHIKSRHSGCNVSMDISKVKLRVKKPGPDGTEENSRANKSDNSSNVEDFDMDEDSGDADEGMEASPINLSIRKSSRPSISQPLHSEVPDKIQKKANVTSEKEKIPKAKEPEKKVTTRQKKVEKVKENLLENAPVKEIQTETVTPAVNPANKAKRRVKKHPAEKTTARNQVEVTESEDQMQQPDQQRSEEEREERQKAENKEAKLQLENGKEHQKNDVSGKENKSLSKLRKSGLKKSEKIPEHVEEAPQKLESSEKIQKEKVVKEKPAKRKAAEALDLSRKSSSETPSKTRRPKATTAEMLQLKPTSENTQKINDTTQMPHRSSGTTPVKQKKTRSTSKKATGLQQAVVPVKDKKASINSSPTDTPEESSQPDNPKLTIIPEFQPTENSSAQKNPSTDQTTPVVPEKVPNKPPEKMEVSPTCSSGQRSKPTDPEDDEGIHSSHEGGSDISDSASEGSDDSGLNGNGAGSGKMANDPETPTEEIPTPTELKSHLCIFCDRTFPLEMEYRRHLNRHLVNVYYMDNTNKGQK
uniref:RE1-silencing transcription factor isoform X2 n=1 Tax=Scatophagus argus TaxID=75038 RepID=UPI001ED7CE61|nr:RE1-silencing transcription factor isoform X2 [Scatophagus argus]